MTEEFKTYYSKIGRERIKAEQEAERKEEELEKLRQKANQHPKKMGTPIRGGIGSFLDACKYGIGISKGGKHVPLSDFLLDYEKEKADD